MKNFFCKNKSSMDKMQQLNRGHQEALMKLKTLESVPAAEQEESGQLLDYVQELQRLLNQEFRRKTAVLQEGIAQKKSDYFREKQAFE